MKKVPVHTVFEYLGTMPDPRIDRTKDHKLLDIVVVAVCAVICGADGWVGIEEFGKSKLDWFKQFPGLPNGIPSHDTKLHHEDLDSYQAAIEFLALSCRPSRGNPPGGAFAGCVSLLKACSSSRGSFKPSSGRWSAGSVSPTRRAPPGALAHYGGPWLSGRRDRRSNRDRLTASAAAAALPMVGVKPHCRTW